MNCPLPQVHLTLAVRTSLIYSSIHLFIYFDNTGVWTQGLHLELLHQPYFFFNGCFWDRVSQTICPGWLWIAILLISASWVAGITDVSHWCPAGLWFLRRAEPRTSPPLFLLLSSPVIISETRSNRPKSALERLQSRAGILSHFKKRQLFPGNLRVTC
jgi:hypothetical protein